MILFLTLMMIILDLILIGVIIMEKKTKPEGFYIKDYTLYILIILASFIAMYFLNR